MSSDKRVSELISKSFRQQLSSEEQRTVNDSLQESSEAEAYAALAGLINDSVVGIAAAAEADDPAAGPGLSDEAKQRLRKSVRQAKSESQAGGEATPSAITGGSGSLSTEHNTLGGDIRRSASRFTLMRKIGEGGLGTVWLARDEDLKRTVAIKEMHPDKADSPKHMLRFHREAEVTGLLEHPNVVPLYMFGVNAETGRPFYAMRFLGKQTLADAIVEFHARRKAGQAESIDLHRLLTVFLDVCQAIAYANSRGVVHRDLKPENVALDSFGQVIVLDWGIAKLMSEGDLATQASLSADHMDESPLTKTIEGEVVGTPLYMAPEQAAGELSNVDQRTDVYGLGAILFAILTGSAPHAKTKAQAEATSMPELLKAIAERDTPIPRDYNSQVPRDLEAICVRAMGRERYTRQASATELATDVERWIAGQHEKRKLYEAMRLDGRDLRSNLASSIRDFATNVRFMATLPPIEGLIDAAASGSEEDSKIWRQRLSTIFEGLLGANSAFSAISYSRATDGQLNELVRVERPDLEIAVRTVPKSRLFGGDLPEFGQIVMQQKPDDVFFALTRGTRGTTDGATLNRQLRIQAGTPIFDDDEEPFGLVVIEGDFQRLVTTQLQARNRAWGQILVIGDDDVVILQDGDGGLGAIGKTASTVIPEWDAIRAELSINSDFVDLDGQSFATRVDLVPHVSSLAIVLLSEGPKANQPM